MSFFVNFETVTSGHRDLITLLLKSTDAKGAPNFTERQIHAQLFTFLFAGFETTSTAIHSILYHLGDEPEWAAKIAAEFEVLILLPSHYFILEKRDSHAS